MAQALDKRKICCRAGLHCAPSAHRHFGTLETGAVRLAPSAFTTREEIDRVSRAIWYEAHAAQHGAGRGESPGP